MEIRLLIKWNKGNVVEYLIEILGFVLELSDYVFLIYMGDDILDEDVFKVNNNLFVMLMCYNIMISLVEYIYMVIYICM